jgi:hypothetical protein
VGRYAGEEEPQRAKRGTENLILIAVARRVPRHASALGPHAMPVAARRTGSLAATEQGKAGKVVLGGRWRRGHRHGERI